MKKYLRFDKRQQVSQLEDEKLPTEAREGIIEKAEEN